jgi:hypothetical protein
MADMISSSSGGQIGRVGDLSNGTFDTNINYHQPHNLMEVFTRLTSERRQWTTRLELMELENNNIGWTSKHGAIPSCLVVQCRKFTTLGDPGLSCAGTLGRYFTTLGNPVLSCAGTLGRYFTTLGNPVLSFDSSL